MRKPLQIRLSEAEKAQAQAAAEKIGVSLAAWVRMVIKASAAGAQHAKPLVDAEIVCPQCGTIWTAVRPL